MTFRLHVFRTETFALYRVIKKSLCTWWLQYRKIQVMFKVSPASLQTFTDTPNCVLEDRVQYSTVHIPNVFCDDHLQLINCVGIVRIHWGFFFVRCTETSWSSCIISDDTNFYCQYYQKALWYCMPWKWQIAGWHVGGCEKKGKQTNQYSNQFSVEMYTMTHKMLRAPLINQGSFGTICSSRSPYTVGAVGWSGLP
jgi:hypothetical protein